MKHRFAIVFSIVLVLIMAAPFVAAAVMSGSRQAETENIAAKAGAEEEIRQEEPIKQEEPVRQEEHEPEEQEETDGSEEIPEDTDEEPAVREPLPKYEPYLEVNPYVAGWLAIDGTKIDDPVVYTPGSQNYYLHRALDGSLLERGTFFIAINWKEKFNNTLIYGHNMKDGSGFGGLSAYADEAYGTKHSVIRFDTLYDEKEYRLLAAFYSQIDEDELETEEDRAEADALIEEGKIDLGEDFGDEDIYRQEKDEDNGRFRYYYFNDLSDRADFDYFVDNVMQRALYDTGEEVSWGDELLTLSTCSYHVKNGRFVVVAVHHPE